MGAGTVPTELVEIAFRRKSFAKPRGLYFYAQPEHRMDSFDGVSFTSVSDTDDAIRGFLYIFRGHPILLWLDHTPIGNCVFESGLLGSGFQFRTEQMNLTRNQQHFRSIHFRWN